MYVFSTRTTWLGALLLIAGCSEPSEPFGAVNGSVTFEGKRVPDAIVVFEATGSPLSITADVDETGHYQARRSVDMPGLPPGEYRVAVTPPLFYPGLGPAGARPPQRDDIPQKYRNPSTSELTIEVTNGQEQVLDISMSP